MVYVGIVGIVVFAILLSMLLYVIFRPTHDYVADIKENNAKLHEQIESYNRFERTMAKIYKELDEEIKKEMKCSYVPE